MTSRSDESAQAFLALLYEEFGKDHAFMARNILNATKNNKELRTFISRAGLLNSIALGMYLGALEGTPVLDARLWRERESRRAHVYSLRSGS